MSGERVVPARPTPDSSLGRAVEAYLDHLTVERGVARNTELSYRRDLDRYVQWCRDRGIRDLQAITESDVGEFLAALRSGYGDHPPLSASSAARTVVAVRGFHRFALREGLSDDDPAHEVRPPQSPRRLPKAIPVADVELLLAAASADDGATGLRDRALLELLYGCGARISEAVGLDVDDLDLDRGAVLLRGKGGKERLVPLGSYAREAVDAQEKDSAASRRSQFPLPMTTRSGARLSTMARAAGEVAAAT